CGKRHTGGRRPGRPRRFPEDPYTRNELSPTPLLAAAPHIPGGCGTRRGAGSRAAPPLRRAPLAAFIVGSSGPASFATGCSTQPEEVQMSPVHFHLLLNHVPVIGTLVAIALLA